MSLVGGAAWSGGLIAINAVSVDFIWARSATVLLFTTWVCAFCYFETIWVLKRIDVDIEADKLSMHASGAVAMLNLVDILRTQEGFEAMMRFLVKEFSCEILRN